MNSEQAEPATPQTGQAPVPDVLKFFATLQETAQKFKQNLTEQQQPDATQQALASAAKNAQELLKADSKTYVEAKNRLRASALAYSTQQLTDIQPISDPNRCPDEQRPPISTLFSPSSRPRVTGDYIVLEYNASPESLQTRWYDYRRTRMSGRNPIDEGPAYSNLFTVQRNGSFLPVVYSKEKILVHVCGLHFSDLVTVSNNATAISEGGVDIRGASPVTSIPTLSPALDSLQSIGATGNTVTIGGLGFGPTPAITTSGMTGITNGTLSHGQNGLTYNDAQISVSPEQLALMMYALKRNSIALSELIESKYTFSVDSPEPVNFERYPRDEFNHVALEAIERFDEVYDDSKSNVRMNDAARFDQDMANVQNLSSETTNFLGTIASQGLGTRAATLWSNYAILRAPLQVLEGYKRNHNCVHDPSAQDAANAAAQTAAQKKTSYENARATLTDTPAQSPKRAALERNLQTAKKDYEAAAAAAKKTADAAKRPVNCDEWERKNAELFLTRYWASFENLVMQDPNSADKVRNWDPIQMFQSLERLQCAIEKLTTVIASLYSEMNLWNDLSTVEQQDSITPANGNTIERISIAVQHGYVPFSLATYVTSTTPTISAPVVPTVVTAASSSNPTHTVKTVFVEVHRRANFNLLGAAMVLRVPNTTYATQAGATPATLVTGTPTPTMSPSTVTGTTVPVFTYTFTYNGVCGGVSTPAATTTVSAVGTAGSSTAPSPPPAPPNAAAPGYTCVIQTQTGKTQLAGMAGLTWFPGGRDYFPLRNGYAFQPHNLVPGIYAATSVTALGNSSFGFSFEPFRGIDLMIGAGMAHTSVLPSGVTTTTALPPGYSLQTVTHVNWGWSYGVGLDFSVFSQIFSKGPSAVALP